MKGLKVAAYYGCQITRPYSFFDDPEFPSSLEKILSWIEVETIDFPMKAKCCGGMLMLINENATLNLIEKILRSASRWGAECIVTAYPLC